MLFRVSEDMINTTRNTWLLYIMYFLSKNHRTIKKLFCMKGGKMLWMRSLRHLTEMELGRSVKFPKEKRLLLVNGYIKLNIPDGRVEILKGKLFVRGDKHIKGKDY